MLVSTYSICACDLEARQWGVAVQSKFLARRLRSSPGPSRSSARSRRSRGRTRATGPRGSRSLREGLPAEEVVARLTDADEYRAQRQLGVVDGQGRGASYTGDECNEWAGGRVGDGYAAQGNILVSAETVDALAENLRGDRRQAARRAAARLPRRGAGGGRRPPRAAVGRDPRRRARAGLRRALGRLRRPARGRPRAPARGAPAHRRHPPRALRARLRATAGSRSTTRCARRSTSGSRSSASSGSRTGPARRTSRSASTARTRSTRSCSNGLRRKTG